MVEIGQLASVWHPAWYARGRLSPTENIDNGFSEDNQQGADGAVAKALWSVEKASPSESFPYHEGILA